MISIDNSSSAFDKPSLLQAQKDAIQLYCEAKLNSHPANLVGLATMGTQYYSHIVYPTRDVDKFQDQLQQSTDYNNAGGSLHLFNAVFNAQFGFRTLKSKTMNRRQLIFVVGPITSSSAAIKAIAASLQVGNIAVDFVCFECDDYVERLMQIHGFDALKEAVDGNKNNHFVYVPRQYSVCEVLLRNKILPSNFQKRIRKLSLAASVRSLSLEEDTTWLKNKADAVAIEDVEPTQMSDENNMLFINSEIKKTPPLSLKESQEKTKKKKKQTRKGKKHATAAAEYVDPGDTKAFVQELEKLKQKVGTTLAQELEKMKQMLEASTSRNKQVG